MIRILSVVSGCLLWSGLAYAVPLTLQDNGFKGLEQANLVAGEHGQQGRDNAAFRQAISFPQNASFRTGQGGLPPSKIGGAALDSPTTVPSSPSQSVSVPEPTSVFLLGLALVGLWFWRVRKSQLQ